MKQHPSHTPEDPRRRSGSGFISGLILELKNILHDYGTMQLLGLLLLLIKHTASSELIYMEYYWNVWDSKTIFVRRTPLT